MSVNRRGFLTLATGAAAAAMRAKGLPIAAVALDAFVVFDPRPALAQADRMSPGLADEWRTRQFEYCWLRVCSGRYADFWRVTRDSLRFAANKLRLDLAPADRDRLLNAYASLQPWPDVVPVVQAIRKAGIRLALLSNFTPAMLEANINSAGISGMFDAVVSTDASKTYKPDPKAYELGEKALHVSRDRIIFAAFAGWDAAGARQFGYPTFWVNRQQQPLEELGVLPDGSGVGLADLQTFLASSIRG